MYQLAYPGFSKQGYGAQHKTGIPQKPDLKQDARAHVIGEVFSSLCPLQELKQLVD